MDNLTQLSKLKDLKIVDVKQFVDNENDRPEFSNKRKKLFFFLLREGLLSTYRKVRSSKKYLGDQKRYLTFLIVELKEKKYINASIQYQGNPEFFVIENKFVPYQELDFTSIEKNVPKYLQKLNQFVSVDYRILNITQADSISIEKEKPQSKMTFDKGLFIYGLGSYVSTYVMPRMKGIRRIACIDYNNRILESFASSYKFENKYLVPSDSYEDIKNTKEPYVIIATYHSDHSKIASEIYSINPNTQIFIEKPPCVTLDDLNMLLRLYKKNAKIDIGFNRRHIPINRYVKGVVKDNKLFITCSIKEVLINNNHWYFWKNQGTRITGNIVHWIDLANYWVDSDPVEMNFMADENDKESFSLSVLYENGSILNLTSSDEGNSLRGVQEKIEIRFDDQTIFIDDYMKLTHIRENGAKKTKRKQIRDKGHSRMYKRFKNILFGKEKSRYLPSDLIRTSVLTYYASQMQVNNQKHITLKEIIKEYYK